MEYRVSKRQQRSRRVESQRSIPAVPSSIRALLVALLAVGAFAFAAPARAHAAACTPAGPPVPGAPALPGSCSRAMTATRSIRTARASATTGSTGSRHRSASVTSKADDFVSGGNDSQFGPGGSEETPDSWTFDFGSLGSDKYDIVSGYLAQEPDTADLFLALAFIRAANNGTSHLAFELNQKQPGYRTATEDGSGRVIKVPTRSPGDLLITYSVDPPDIGICKWSGNEHTGHWLDFSGNQVAGSDCPALPANLVQGAMNSATITAANNFLQNNANPLDRQDLRRGGDQPHRGAEGRRRQPATSPTRA